MSLLLHGAVIGGAATVFWPSPPAPEPETIPIYFEVVEASALDAAEQSVELEDSGREATAPVPSGSVPVDSGSVPVDKDIKVSEIPGNRAESSEKEKMPSSKQEPGIEKEGSDRSNKGEEEKQSQPSAAASEEHAAVVSDPIALNRIVPVYPRLARRKGHEGVVTVAISVAEDGVVAHAEVVSSSGYRELDGAALSAVRSARFAPATSDGVSVRGELRLTFDFRLK